MVSIPERCLNSSNIVQNSSRGILNGVYIHDFSSSNIKYPLAYEHCLLSLLGFKLKGIYHCLFFQWD